MMDINSQIYKMAENKSYQICLAADTEDEAAQDKLFEPFDYVMLGKVFKIDQAKSGGKDGGDL